MLTGKDNSYLQYEVEKRNAIYLKKATPNLVNNIIDFF